MPSMAAIACARIACESRTRRSGDIAMTGQWNVGAVCSTWTARFSTRAVYFDSLIAALNAHGYTDDTALCQAMVGLPGPDCEAMLHARYGEHFRCRRQPSFFIAIDEILQQACR
jgi:hypothetical protein